VSQAMTWILVVGHALNQEWFQSSKKSFCSISIQPQLQERDLSAYRSEKSEVLTYDWKRLIKGRRRIFAFLSFVSFSKLVILVNTGQPVENNTAYARYRQRPTGLTTSSPRLDYQRLASKSSGEGLPRLRARSSS
jgi:hypothetical protein